jgi:hypothetical protein
MFGVGDYMFALGEQRKCNRKYKFGWLAFQKKRIFDEKIAHKGITNNVV